jgi:hypothetical protein
MTARTATQAFAAATAALTSGRDATDILDQLMRDSAEVLGARAVGLLIVAANGDLELLSATSHQMAELELFQIQQDNGPCIDAIRGGAPVSADGRDDIRARWPRIGEAVTSAGFQNLRAYPLRWRDRTLGALNAIYISDASVTADAGLLGQALADIAAAIIVQTGDLTDEQITERVQQVMQARTAIEQAKGVLAYTQNINLAAAYDLLRRLAAEDRATLTATATGVVAHAQNRKQT